jgi:[histone H3]-lysine36 N-dimethyltransferase SETMAR
MLNISVQQRVNVKFCLKLGKTATECHETLKTVYGSDCLSRTQIFEWYKRFKDGRESFEDDERSGRPRTSITDSNVEKVKEVIRKDRRLGVRAIAELTHINRESVRRILVEELDMKKVCAKMVPRLLTPEQKECRMNISADILESIERDPNFLERVVTCDETWIFQYDPETKRQSMHWKSKNSPRMKKARMSKSRFKAMLIVFFDIKGVIHIEWVPEGCTVNQYYYIQVLTTLRERVRRKRPELWEENSWILHQDNAPAHNALSVKQFLAKHSITLMEHPPYSPDLAPCDFFLFPKIKVELKGTRHESVDAVKEVATQLLNSLSENDLQHCFQQWKTRLQRCRDRGGEYIEGDKS